MFSFLIWVAAPQPWLKAVAATSDSLITINAGNYRIVGPPCPCSKFASSCNPYCCCDPLCPSASLSHWNAFGLCTSEKNQSSSLLETGKVASIMQLTSKTQFFSNYYVYNASSALIAKAHPNSAQITDPSLSSNVYLPGILLRTPTGTIPVLKTTGSSFCGPGNLQFGVEIDFTCTATVTSANCNADLSKFVTQLCSTYACASKVALSYVGTTAASISGASCNNLAVVRSYSIVYSTTSQFQILSISVALTNQNVAIGAIVPIRTTVSFKSVVPPQSGPLGYSLGFPLYFYSNSTGTPAIIANAPKILLGANFMVTYSPAANDPYQQFRYNSKGPTLLLQRYAGITNQFVPVSQVTTPISNGRGLPGSKLVVYYSYAVSTSSPSYYVVAADLVRFEGTGAKQFFGVQFRELDPSQLQSSLSNFYGYIRRVFGPINSEIKWSSGLQPALLLAFVLMMM